MRQLWTRAAVIALTAGTLAACESTGGAQYPTRGETATPNFPIVQAPVANQQPEGPTTPPEEPQPTISAPAGSVGVSSQPLAPAQSYTPQPQQQQQPEYRPAPAARPVVVTTVGGPVVTIAGPPKTYKVKAGDNIDAIARTLGTTRADLAKDNDLKSPFRIRPGQVLKGPDSKDAKAYVVQTGDTMFAIAKRFSVSAAALGDENDLGAGAAIKKGQKLRLPSGYKDKGPLKTTVTTTPPAPRPVTPAPSYTPPAATTPTPTRPYTPPATTPAPAPSTPRPYTPSPSTSYPRPTGPVSAQPVTPPPSSGQIIGSSPPPTEAEITAAGRGRFVWPLQGSTISDFGNKGAGQRNDGVNIRAAAGTPVRAAAAGEVVYAGNQVPGFGNLVLVKHADGWVTAYAHLSSTDVKMRQQVAQGATLGAVGQTGGVTEPQLHFEVRYAPTPKDKARPVDPGLVLPR